MPIVQRRDGDVVHAHGYYSATRKDIPLLAATWMDLVGITRMSKIKSDRERQASKKIKFTARDQNGEDQGWQVGKQ